MIDHQLPHFDLDLRGSVCPMAFVRLRLFADTQSAGVRFYVLFEDSKANEPLKRSTEGLGYHVVAENSFAVEGNQLKLMTVEKPA